MNTKAERGEMSCEGGVAYKNRACQQTQVPYERYISYVTYACLSACVCVCECFKAHLWPFVLVSFMHFPTREGQREREMGSEGERQRERGHCQAFCHVVYFVYKRVPLTYFVPHNERS